MVVLGARLPPMVPVAAPQVAIATRGSRVVVPTGVSLRIGHVELGHVLPQRKIAVAPNASEPSAQAREAAAAA
jgi:hypothetical protein